LGQSQRKVEQIKVEPGRREVETKEKKRLRLLKGVGGGRRASAPGEPEHTQVYSLEKLCPPPERWLPVRTKIVSTPGKVKYDAMDRKAAEILAGAG
jgi:hypothetical protein